MGIPKGFYTNKFGSLDVNYKRNGMSVNISYKRLGKKMDKAQDALDAKIWNDMQLYMPNRHSENGLVAETNTLNQNTRGEVYIYPPTSIIPYGHYLHEGWLYVDPITGSPFARKGEKKGKELVKVTKVPTMQRLNYPSNPDATWHWEETAFQKHKKEWIQEAKRNMR